MGGFDLLWSAAQSTAAGLTSDEAQTVAMVALGLVLMWSGVAKARRPELAALALVDFRVARRARRANGVALATGELALAAGLLAAPAVGGPYAAVIAAAAALLFGALTILLARALRAHESFSCFCFGESEGTITTVALLRTAGLAVVAALTATLATDLVVAPAGDVALDATIASSAIGLIVMAAALRRIRSWAPRPPVDQGEIAA